MRLIVPRLAAAAPVAVGDANGRVAKTVTGNDDAGDAAVAIVRAKCGFRDNKGSNMQLLRRRCCQ